MKFWEWLRSYANKKVKEKYMDIYHHDRKCVNCNIWTSEVDGCKSIEEDGEWHELMECKNCGYKSRWFLGGMLPTLAENSNNLQENNNDQV